MKVLLVLCFGFISFSLFSQKKDPHYYRLDEVSKANPDTIFYLTLSKEKLDSIPSSIYRFTELKGLDLSKNKLTDIPLELSVFSKLEVLNISQNKLPFLPVSVTKLSSLLELLAASNRISSLPDQLEDLIKLKNLDLYNNEITNFGKGFFLLKNLQQIDIRGTMYGKKVYLEIKTSFPNTKVYVDPPCECMD